MLRLRQKKTDEDLFQQSTMTFGEHLEELRGCLFKSIVGLMIGFIIGLAMGRQVAIFMQSPLTGALEEYYATQSKERAMQVLAELEAAGAPAPYTVEQIGHLIDKEHLLVDVRFVDPLEMFRQVKAAFPEKMEHVEVPPPDTTRVIRREDLAPLFSFHSVADDPRLQLKSFNVQEGFMIWMKAALLVGALGASPWIFYQIWSFVAAGLYSHERHYVRVYLPFSLGLFLTGAAVAFFLVFPPVLHFLLGFNKWMGIAPEPRINEWLGFLLLLPLGFGIAFQLPLVMFFLERIGVFTVKSYTGQWRIAVLTIFIIAAILTPPDPYSMSLLAIPLSVLYFGGIMLCKLIPRKEPAFDELEG